MENKKQYIEREIKDTIGYINQLLDQAALSGLMIQVLSHGVPGRLLVNDLTQYTNKLSIVDNDYYL